MSLFLLRAVIVVFVAAAGLSILMALLLSVNGLPVSPWTIAVMGWWAAVGVAQRAKAEWG